jgi:hypothetical protein
LKVAQANDHGTSQFELGGVPRIAKAMYLAVEEVVVGAEATAGLLA